MFNSGIKNDTHTGAISTEEAEQILYNANLRRNRFTRTRRSDYVLTSLAKCKCGANLVGDAGYYRCQNKCGAPKVKQERLEGTVIFGLLDEVLNEDTFQELKREIAKQSAHSKPHLNKKAIKSEIAKIEAGQRKLTKLLLSVKHNRSILEQIDTMEERRNDLQNTLSEIESRRSDFMSITGNKLREFIANCREGIKVGVPDKRKALMRSIIGHCDFLGDHVAIISPVTSKPINRG